MVVPCTEAYPTSHLNLGIHKENVGFKEYICVRRNNVIGGKYNSPVHVSATTRGRTCCPMWLPAKKMHGIVADK